MRRRSVPAHADDMSLLDPLLTLNVKFILTGLARASLVANSAATARLRWDWALCQRRPPWIGLWKLKEHDPRGHNRELGRGPLRVEFRSPVVSHVEADFGRYLAQDKRERFRVDALVL